MQAFARTLRCVHPLLLESSVSVLELCCDVVENKPLVRDHLFALHDLLHSHSAGLRTRAAAALVKITKDGS